MDDTLVARMVDVAFALEAADGPALPREYRQPLAAALEAALPWLAERDDGAPATGVHRLNLAAGAGGQTLLSRRTRLTLRVPRERAPDALALRGRELRVGSARLHLGEAQVRELLPWGTIYAHFVAAIDEDDEAAFLRHVQAELDELAVAARAICGRAQALEAGRLHGFSLMLDGLTATQALRLMDSGLGAHRRLGCGLFVPHKSAAAVGAPP